MSGYFEANWLDLREPADLVARSFPLQEHLANIVGAERHGECVIHDLGAGTGANLRALAPFLGGKQRWFLLDHDARLLEFASDRLVRWCVETGGEARESSDGLLLTTESWAGEVSMVHQDLSGALFEGLPRADLITGSALLDLVSPEWLEQLVGECRAAVLYFPLNYNGHMRFHLALEADRRIAELFNRHQSGDKGFGPAMGGQAPRRSSEILTSCGFDCQLDESPWELGVDQGGLQQELLKGIAAAALELSDQPEQVDAWLAHRLAALERGESWLRIGHEDLLAVPEGQLS
ncbi:MAG: class I SAM-dependent methyltransferase [Pseudomonadota bacterium]|uniref:class I SAM-dependent methyltransferase n=1 Tax=Fodinicurvata fenggangensis TaxID=1121830 RepID=UPI00068D0356|nr:class I SAM-dependent methyltransferase [Fodinicurvata fenggangensis]